MRKPRVYVAGPIASDPLMGTHKAVSVATVLLERGFVPFVPHLNVLWQMMCPQTVETWLEWDFAWVEVCDGLLRLEGESPGADREILHAVKNGIPVFYSLDTLFAWKETFRG